MQRSGIIAAVVAASGILVAGSVASVAVINAASSNAVVSGQVTLIASPVALPTEVAEAAETPDGSVESTPSAEPSLDPNEVGGEDLPAIPQVTPRTKASTSKTTTQRSTQSQARPAAKPASKPAARPAAKPAAKPVTKPAAKPAAKPASKPAAKPAAKPSAKPTQAAAPEISGDQARDIVLASTGGGITRSVTHTEHNGYTAWAVQVTRHDTSTVTGWVEVHSGSIYDWHVDTPANPTPSPASGGDSHSSGGHNNGGHGGDD